MNTREYGFENLFGSVFDLGENNIKLSKIEIPIIQRDYAQGRKNNAVQRIRERFLDALYQAITSNKKITLDFVYGDVSEDGVLTPLDGQQRLTTLFLLHWYIAKKEKINPQEYEFLNRFSYATRFSSRDFCQALVKYDPNFSEAKLSPAIKDQAWYPYEWKNDPTIQSMLVMIDAIHEKFHGQSGLWESLVTNKNVSFYFLPLAEMGLTDELYIKMNSRGRPLTPFEHFKAEFQEIIKQTSKELSNDIIYKIDVDWTHMLFPFRNTDNIIDDGFMRYFHFISDMISYASGYDHERDEFKVARLLYSSENDHAKSNIEYLQSSFDCWLELDIPQFFESIFSRNTYVNGKVSIYQNELNIFKECLDNYGEYSGRNRRFPLNKMLLLYSVLTYLQNKENISEDQFRRRIRIIRNLIWNSTDEIRDDRMKALLRESKIVMLSGEIPISEVGELGFSVSQKQEERKKNEWLMENGDKENELYRLEDHSLLRGCVSIVDMSDVCNFKKFTLLFDRCDKDLVNRVLLSLGDYSQLVSWRVQIGARNNESVWFDLFHPTKQRLGFENSFKIINEFLAGLDESDINNASIEKRVNEFLESEKTQKDWRYYFVKYRPMREGNFGMYYWQNVKEKNYEVIMMNTEKSIGGKNWNVFLYTLKQLPEFAGKLSLGDYAYQGSKLKIIDINCEIESQNDKYVVTIDGNTIEYPILQQNGIDIEDRVEKGKEVISSLLHCQLPEG